MQILSRRERWRLAQITDWKEVLWEKWHNKILHPRSGVLDHIVWIISSTPFRGCIFDPHGFPEHLPLVGGLG